MIVVGIISAVIGGLGAKVLELFGLNKRTKFDQVEFLQQQNMQLDGNLEEIREKYYKMMQRNLELEAKIDKLQSELDDKDSPS